MEFNQELFERIWRRWHDARQKSDQADKAEDRLRAKRYLEESEGYGQLMHMLLQMPFYNDESEMP